MTTTVATRRAVGYRRVSTERQATERHVSLPTQEQHIGACVDREGWTLVASFTDVASGRKDERAEYRKMLDFVRNGHADVIVVQFLDRFGRNPREILRRYWDLEEAGVSVVCSDEDTHEELMLLMRAGLAGAESKRTSERVSAAMRHAVENGKRGGATPYGVKRVKDVDGTHYELNEEEARMIRHAVHLLTTENIGFRTLAELIHAEGYRTRVKSAWSSTSLYRVLLNTSLRGALTLGDGTVLEGFYPAVLTDAEFESLQERLAIRRMSPRGRTHSSSYLLSGIAKCGYCQGPLTGSMVVLKNKTRRGRYHCARHAQNRSTCPHNNGHYADQLDQAVLEALDAYTDPKRARELLAAGDGKKRTEKTKQLAATDRELAKLDADLKADLDLLRRQLLDERDFAVANQGRRERRVALEAERAELAQAIGAEEASERAVTSLPARIAAFSAEMRQVDVRTAKAKLQTILKAVYVTREGIELEFRS